jgi:hypothetical protein
MLIILRRKSGLEVHVADESVSARSAMWCAVLSLPFVPTRLGVPVGPLNFRHVFL